MIDNIVTFSQLKCPNKQLECVLKELFCKYADNSCLGVNVDITNNVLTVTVGVNKDSVDLTPYLDNTHIVQYTINNTTGDITIKESNNAEWTINIANAINNLETVTSLTQTTPSNLEYKDENGTVTNITNYTEVYTIFNSFNTVSLDIIIP